MKQGSSFGMKQGNMIALAVAAAFVVPQAMAQVSGPDVGAGKGLTLAVDILAGVGSKNASGATAGAASDTIRRTEVFSSSSSVYFRGSEKLNGSFLQGWGFQITADFDPDEYNRRGAFEAGATVIGLKTTAGDVFLGTYDNPYKVIGSRNIAATSSWCNGCSQSGYLGTPGFRTGTAKGSQTGSAAGGGVTTTSTMSFYRLNSNSMNYYSPSWNGFKVYAQYVPGDSDVPAGTTVSDQNAWSLAFTYDNGPFNVGLAYEKRKDYLWGGTMTGNNFGAGSAAAGVGNHSSDDGMVLTLGYTIGNFRLGGYWQRMDYSQSGPALTATSLTDLQVDSWYFGVRWRMGGPHSLAAFYAYADDVDCNPGAQNAGGACAPIAAGVGNAVQAVETGMKAYGIAYNYQVSKQLKFFGGATRYDNDRNAMYAGHSSAARVGVSAAPAAAAVNPAGLQLTNFTVGMSGSF